MEATSVSSFVMYIIASVFTLHHFLYLEWKQITVGINASPS